MKKARLNCRAFFIIYDLLGGLIPRILDYEVRKLLPVGAYPLPLRLIRKRIYDQRAGVSLVDDGGSNRINCSGTRGRNCTVSLQKINSGILAIAKF